MIYARIKTLQLVWPMGDCPSMHVAIVALLLQPRAILTSKE